MPLDSTPWSRTTETETKPDLSKPSLEGLSWLLRHLPTELPNHSYKHWDFASRSSCGTAGCAYGICEIVWPAYVPSHETESARRVSRKLFGDAEVYEIIFQTYAYDCDPRSVTPTMVADRIDAYLAETRK